MAAQVALSASIGYATCGDYLQHGASPFVYGGQSRAGSGVGSSIRRDLLGFKSQELVLHGQGARFVPRAGGGGVLASSVLAGFDVSLPSPCSDGRCGASPRVVSPLSLASASQRDFSAWVASRPEGTWVEVDGRWSVPVSESLPLGAHVSVDAPPPRR